MGFFWEDKNATKKEENLRETADDDSFATRSSRSVAFVDEPEEKEEPEYTSRHARSFLDAVNFDEEEKVEQDGGLDEEEVEKMTDSEREARFKGAEFAELTDSQRAQRESFLNETTSRRERRELFVNENNFMENDSALVAKGAPHLGEMRNLLLSEEDEFESSDNLMAEEGIPMDMLDAKERYQDGFISDAVKISYRKTRCSRYSRNGVIFLLFMIILTFASMKVAIITGAIKRRQGNNVDNQKQKTDQIDTPTIDSEFFVEDDRIRIPALDPDDDDYDDDDFCKDNPTFLHNGLQGQNCHWVARSDTVARCAREGVTENCRATCDPECAYPTAFPTEEPTRSPREPGSPTWSPTWVEYISEGPFDGDDDAIAIDGEEDFFPTENPTAGPTDTFPPTWNDKPAAAPGSEYQNSCSSRPAATFYVKAGADNGELVFDPPAIDICKGDSVEWINNKGGPHNIIFDDEFVPKGVNAEAISMEERLQDEGDIFRMKFTVKGSYEYYCEAHLGVGMVGFVVVR